MTQRTQAESPRASSDGPATPPHRYTADLANRIEAEWQRRWEETGVFQAPNPTGELSDGFSRVEGLPKLFVLDMFPYPSGAGLHVGHPLGYIATDIFARFKRMTGHNVLHAMGYDAFGLPAEQYAVQTGTHPRITTERNIESMRSQLKRLGLAHDDRRSVATTDVSFYRWTQWIFLQIFNAWYDESQDRARPIDELIQAFESGKKAPESDANPDNKAWADLDDLTRRQVVNSYRLAYQSEQPVNWCPALGTVLANEEVTADGKSERGNHPVYRRPLKQWVMRITSYADRLLNDLDLVDWPEPVKLMQRNWIGRSEGAHLIFPIEGVADAPIRVFTTRPDTVFGASYMVLAPEHPLVDDIAPNAWPSGVSKAWTGGHDSPAAAIRAYRAEAAAKTDIQRQAETKDKTGVFTGAFAINPASGERIPIFIADYVLMGYGTGAIMAVPAHDDRDFDFASAFDIPIGDVVYPSPIAAVAWFMHRATGDEAWQHGWDLALADFVALATSTSYDASTFEAHFEKVLTKRSPSPQRTEEALAAIPTTERRDGTDRRGAVQAEWIETLSDIIGMGFEDAKRIFETGSLWATRGTPYTDPGVAVNSAPINGLRTEEAKRVIGEWIAKQGIGEVAVTYKLRDWLFSRQRYWGEPFPIVFDEHGLPNAVPDSMLPVQLPELEDFAPQASDDPDAPPRPPLGRASDWVDVELDLGDGVKTYRRELNTMPQWAGSCWYYLRYLDPTNQERFCDPQVERYWMRGDAPANSDEKGGVDLYVGGVEHAVLHLLYARFWHKVLFDLGQVSTVEPFQKLFNQGYIQAPAFTDERGFYVDAYSVEERGGDFFFEGEPVKREFGKMGKSLKNSITPDEICENYGADTLRLYEMYMGPLEQSKPWNPRDIIGMHRFLQKVWRNIVDEESGNVRVSEDAAPDETRRAVHKTIAGVRADCAQLQFNTAIAKLNELNNHLTSVASNGACPREAAEAITLMLAPFTPHIADELWRRLGHDVDSVMRVPFPEADESLLVEDEVEIAVQILGKVRGRILVAADADQKSIEATALADPQVTKFLEGKTVRKVIVVPGRLVNIVAT